MSLCGYALLRLLELKAAYVPLIADPALKTRYGLAIGLTGRLLALTAARLKEMLSEEPVFKAPTHFASQLDDHSKVARPEDFTQCLVQVLRALAKYIGMATQRAEPLSDQPTTLLFQEILQGIDQELALFPNQPQSDVVFDLSGDISNEVCYETTSWLPPPCEFPARPAHWRRSPVRILTHRSDAELADDPECLRRFLHFVITDIEIPAIEVCARNVVDFRAMPLAFKVDMARQMWDEARHAIVLADIFEQDCDGSLGEYTFNGDVWTNSLRTTSLAVRLAIQQVLQEGNALDATIAFCDVLRTAGRERLADALDFINADEAWHAHFGNRWLMYLVADSPAEYLQTVERAAECMNVPLQPRAAVNRHARRVAGFPKWFIDFLEELDAGQVRDGSPPQSSI